MKDSPSLWIYIRQRCNALGMSTSDLARATGLSRQTLHSLAQVPLKLPTLATLITLADALRVHPIRLVHLVFEHSVPLPVPARHIRHDQSVFVRDVTYADGELVLPGQRFVKTWELQNLGRVAWTDRFLQCMDEEVVVYTRSGETMQLAHTLRPTEARIPIPPTAPGQLLQISAEFTAPDSPGTVLSYWKSVFADGRLCFPHSRGLWVKVRVTSMAAGAVEERGQ